MFSSLMQNATIVSNTETRRKKKITSFYEERDNYHKRHLNRFIEYSRFGSLSLTFSPVPLSIYLIPHLSLIYDYLFRPGFSFFVGSYSK